MKKLIINLLLLVIVFTQCTEKRESDNDIITIAGKIYGIGDDIITLISFEELKKTEIKGDGSFSISFNYDHEWYFSLLISGRYFRFFLEPGDSIYFSVDMNDIEGTYRTSGDKANEAVFLELKQKNLNDIINWRELIEIDEYLRNKEELLHPFTELVEELMLVKGIDKNFLTLEQAWIDYFDLYMDDYYLNQYRRVYGMTQDESIDLLEKEVKERIVNIDFNDPVMLLNPHHRMFMDRKLSELRAELYDKVPESEKGNNSFMACIIKAADSLFHNHRARDFMKYRHLSILMGMSGPKDYQSSYEQFLEDNTTPMYSYRLKEIIEKWSYFAPGMEVPDFTFTDIDDNEVKLSDLDGNLVYIKIWITGCGPCRYEQSFWNELIAEYVEKGVTFLTISLDKEKGPWREMVKEKNIGGFNWYTENEINSEFAQHFMIRAYPKFMIFDSERKIINADAERPSGNIREELNSLL